MPKKSSKTSASNRLSRDEATAQISWHGVHFESTASDSEELDLMLEVVNALSPVDRARIGNMLCDSDAGHCFVYLKRKYAIAANIVTTSAAVVYASFGAVRSISVVQSGH